jgi:hypothetical protein
MVVGDWDDRQNLWRPAVRCLTMVDGFPIIRPLNGPDDLIQWEACDLGAVYLLDLLGTLDPRISNPLT